MTISITGMHRSGTSLLAQLLARCGCYLGAPEELLGADSHNELGYWENYRFLAINERLLAQRGGAWDLPPAAEEGWETRPDILAIQPDAQALIASLQERPIWGWKDPRNSLTLPFWKSLLPELKTVICVRHPLDVALSLQARGSSSMLWGISLWCAYYQTLLDTTTPADRVITHYGQYFTEPDKELQRVLSGLGITPPHEVLLQACQAVSAQLKHHDAAQSETYNTYLPESVLKLYDALCKEALWQIRDSRGSVDSAGSEILNIKEINAGTYSQQPAPLLALGASLADKERIIANLNGSIAHLHLELDAAKHAQLLLQENRLILEQKLQSFQIETESLRQRLQTLQQSAEIASQEVEAVHRSKPWKLAMFFWSWRDRLKRLVNRQ